MKLLGTENIGGRIQRDWLHKDDFGRDVITTETLQDVEPVLEEAKVSYNDSPRRFGRGAMHRVAEIPFTVAEEACRIHKIPWLDFWHQRTDEARRLWNDLLNGRDFRAFRTRPGRIKVGRR